MKYAIEMKAKYNMLVEANSEEDAINKVQEHFEFLETDYPDDTSDITEIEILQCYAQKE